MQSPKKLVENWSWSRSEIAKHQDVDPTRKLYAEVKKVQSIFEAANPGYRLFLTPVRGLEDQVGLWENNPKVRMAAPGSLEYMRGVVGTLPPVPDSKSLEKFAKELKDREASPEPTNAAPGTSDHGRGVAVDFKVWQVDEDGKVARSLPVQARRASRPIGSRVDGPQDLPKPAGKPSFAVHSPRPSNPGIGR